MSRDMPLIAVVTLPFVGSHLAAPFRSNARKSMLGSSTAALVGLVLVAARASEHYRRTGDPKPRRMVAELDRDLTVQNER